MLLSIAELRAWRQTQGFGSDASVGFVPTMGALHEGHLSLLAQSQRENRASVASVFVNPAQFAPHEDFGKYPRQPLDDLAQLFAGGADFVFAPTQDEIYPGSSFGQTSTQVTKTHVVPDGIDSVSEGAARPGFFRGVATVVCKLLNLVQPSRVYLGQKDGLQVLVVRRMVRDFNFPVQVRPCDTVRDADGLAKSSRNVYLSEAQRAAAPALYRALCAVRSSFDAGERSAAALRATGRAVLDAEPLFETQYFSICDALDADELPDGARLPEGNVMVSAAVDFGDCRILDNVLLGEQT